jgi:hypothetical protein
VRPGIDHALDVMLKQFGHHYYGEAIWMVNELPYNLSSCWNCGVHNGGNIIMTSDYSKVSTNLRIHSPNPTTTGASYQMSNQACHSMDSLPVTNKTAGEPESLKNKALETGAAAVQVTASALAFTGLMLTRAELRACAADLRAPERFPCICT